MYTENTRGAPAATIERTTTVNVYLANQTGSLNKQYQADLLTFHPRAEFIGWVQVETTSTSQKILVRIGRRRYEKRYGAGHRISLDALAAFTQELAQDAQDALTELTY